MAVPIQAAFHVRVPEYAVGIGVREGRGAISRANAARKGNRAVCHFLLPSKVSPSVKFPTSALSSIFPSSSTILTSSSLPSLIAPSSSWSTSSSLSKDIFVSAGYGGHSEDGCWISSNFGLGRGRWRTGRRSCRTSSYGHLQGRRCGCGRQCGRQSSRFWPLLKDLFTGRHAAQGIRNIKPRQRRLVVATSDDTVPNLDDVEHLRDWLGDIKLSKRRELSGSLVKYGDKNSQVLFRTGNTSQHAVFVAGLSDGFFATGYIEPLAQVLCGEGWSTIQPMLSSSLSGYGMMTLDQDAEEIEQVIGFLINEMASERIVLIGYSTGCQDIVHYLRTFPEWPSEIVGAILQAPVSDREYLATLPRTPEFLKIAQKLISEGKQGDLMPLEANDGIPITAFRFHSLAGVDGQDDMFSSDLSGEELEAKLGHMARIPVQVIFSMGDEYIPDHVDKKGLLTRLCQAMGGAEMVAIEGGLHDLSNRVVEAVHAMRQFAVKIVAHRKEVEAHRKV